MIIDDTYRAALEIAKDLDNRGIHLHSGQSSILAELVDLSVSCETVKTTMPKTLTGNPGVSIYSNYIDTEESRVADVRCATSSWGDNDSQHDLKISALSDQLSPFVQQHISFTRNTVVPIISALVDKLTTFMQMAKPIDPVSMFEISAREIPAIIQDESFIAGGLENYSGKFVEWRGGYIGLDVSDDPEYYLGLMNVGNDRQNNLIKQWLQTLPPEFVKEVFIRAFSNQAYDGTSSIDYLMPDPGKYGNPYDTMDHALAIYIMGNRLFNEVPSVEGMTLIKYKQVMRDVIDYAGEMLMAGLKTATRQISGRTMVSEAIISKKKIVVNKALYREWLDNGGSPEILFGMMASANVQYSVDAINAIKEKALSNWGIFVSLSQAEIKSDMRRRFRAYIESEVFNGLEEPTPLEVEYMEGKTGIKNKISELVKQELDLLGDCAMDDLYYAALVVVAKCRFYYTSSFLMLKEMIEVSKENPNIDPREAALLGAAIAYLATYFADQTEDTK